MRFNRCFGCMEKTNGESFCQRCGFDLRTYRQPEYALRMGEILQGRYVVGKVLGQGGFGITYIGYDLTLDLKVAIKEYYPNGYVGRSHESSRLNWNFSQTNSRYVYESCSSLIREAKKMAKVDSLPEIARIRDAFLANDTSYLVMDFIEGITLADYVRKKGALSYEETMRILRPVMSALSVIHKKGIVHRDISPDNIMLKKDGTVSLLDLGAAKYTSQATEQGDSYMMNDPSSMLVVKNGFSPMEQYTKRGAIGEWTDVYAMCATMYYCMSGKVMQSPMDRTFDDSETKEVINRISMKKKGKEGLRSGLEINYQNRIQNMQKLMESLDVKCMYNSGESYGEKEEKQSGREKRKKPEKKEPSGKKYIVAIAVVLVVSALVLGGTLLVNNSVKSEKQKTYETAIKLMAAENYEGAKEIFVSLGEYSDSETKIEECEAAIAEAKQVAAESERLESERLESERLESERLESERLESERLESERLESERLESERLESERIESERLESERLESERAESERLESERLESERLESERAESERIESERLESERLESERLESERLESERLESERLESERLESERLESERLESERLESERLESERIATEETNKTVKVGDVLKFGHYEQDNNTSNGTEEIEWQVLDVTEGKALLISKYALAAHAYSDERTSIIWKECDLREWLNDKFFGDAFDPDEKDRIITTKVTADANPKYDTNPGVDTEDKVFLLSICEAERYFTSDEERMCVPTEYAIEQGAWTSDAYSVSGKAICWWWLRSPGLSDSNAAYVLNLGAVSCIGNGVNYGSGCVRPALWINLESLESERLESERIAAEETNKTVKVGDVLEFGHYEQDNNTSNGTEAIEWQVLDVTEGKALLISKYALEARAYNKEWIDTTWEECDLREWLNDKFFGDAFDSDEKDQIRTTKVTADANPEYNANPGTDTEDKIFLLSINEAEQYFTSYEERMCVPTEYAIEQGAWTSDDWSVGGKATCWWWLRSPGNCDDGAAGVTYVGAVRYYGHRVGYDNGCVRPALWINLESLESERLETERIAAEETNKTVKVGDVLEFGHYEQDNNTSNGTEAIEWQVLDVTEGKALLISKYALEARAYNKEWIDTTWEECNLREWLNDIFFCDAFDPGEQNQILTTKVTADENPEYDTNPGVDTEDKIFLLSIL